MGAGASLSEGEEVPQLVDKETARRLAGKEMFDEKQFDVEADKTPPFGVVTRDQFLAAAARIQGRLQPTGKLRKPSRGRPLLGGAIIRGGVAGAKTVKSSAVQLQMKPFARPEAKSISIRFDAKAAQKTCDSDPNAEAAEAKSATTRLEYKSGGF